MTQYTFKVEVLGPFRRYIYLIMHAETQEQAFLDCIKSLDADEKRLGKPKDGWRPILDKISEE